MSLNEHQLERLKKEFPELNEVLSDITKYGNTTPITVKVKQLTEDFLASRLSHGDLGGSRTTQSLYVVHGKYFRPKSVWRTFQLGGESATSPHRKPVFEALINWAKGTDHRRPILRLALVEEDWVTVASGALVGEQRVAVRITVLRAPKKREIKSFLKELLTKKEAQEERELMKAIS